jgi:hypothetical protein
MKPFVSSERLKILNQGVLNYLRRRNVPEGEVSTGVKKNTITNVYNTVLKDNSLTAVSDIAGKVAASSVNNIVEEYKYTSQVQSPQRKKMKIIINNTDDSVKGGTFSNNMYVSVVLCFFFLNLHRETSFSSKYHSL